MNANKRGEGFYYVGYFKAYAVLDYVYYCNHAIKVKMTTLVVLTGSTLQTETL